MLTTTHLPSPSRSRDLGMWKKRPPNRIYSSAPSTAKCIPLDMHYRSSLVLSATFNFNEIADICWLTTFRDGFGADTSWIELIFGLNSNLVAEAGASLPDSKLLRGVLSIFNISTLICLCHIFWISDQLESATITASTTAATHTHKTTNTTTSTRSAQLMVILDKLSQIHKLSL